jgi:hypothetical protein
MRAVRRRQGRGVDRHPALLRCLVNRILLAGVLGGPLFTAADGQPLNRPSQVSPANPPNLYASAGGNDDGGANDCAFASHPCTLQGAVRKVALFAGANTTPTVNLAHGAYASGVSVAAPISLILRGDTGSPESVVIADASASPAAIIAENGANIQLSGMTISSVNGSDIFPSFGAKIVVGAHMIFGASHFGQMHAETGGAVEIPFGYTITGGAPAHWEAVLGGRIIVDESNPVIALSGTPAFTTAFAACQDAGSLIYAPSAFLSFSGSATGRRYSAQSNCTIETNQGGANLLPGDIGGVMFTGGRYLPIPMPTLSATGLGAGGSPGVALVAGSDQQNGAVRLTTGASGVGSSGTVTISMADGGAPSLLTPSFSLAAGTGGWPATTSLVVTSVSRTDVQVTWNTNGAALAASATYDLVYNLTPR